jgi:putative ABC transport system permease protein
MIALALRTLRMRTGGMIGTFVAIFFGAAAVLACGGLMETGIHGSAQPQRLAAAAVVVTGNQDVQVPKNNPGEDDEEKYKTATLPERVRLDAAVADKVAAVPGVVAAIADVSFAAVPVRGNHPVRDGAVYGHGWSSARLAPYTLNGSAPHGTGEVVLDQGLASGVPVGSPVSIVVGGVVHTYKLTGIAAAPAPTRDGAVFFDDATAATLSGHPGRIDAVGVLAAPGTDANALAAEVAAAAPGLATRTGADRALLEFPELAIDSENLIVLSAVSGGMSVLVAIFVVVATLALSLQQRQRELALLRAVGATPGQLRRMVVGEAGVIAVVAGALGCLPGNALGHWLFDQLAGHGVVPAVMEFRQGWVPLVVAGGAALLTAVLGALVAGRKAATTKPTEALTDAAVQRRWLGPVRLILAILAFGGGLALIIVTLTVFDGPIAASTAGPTVLLWALGLAMISPGITRVMVAIVRRPLQWFTGIPGYLATANARANTVRVAAAVTPIMLASGIATGMIYLQTTQVDAQQRAYTESLRADAVVSSATGGLPPDVLTTVTGLPQVAGASELVTSTVWMQRPFDDAEDADDGTAAQGVNGAAAADTVSATVTSGSLDKLTGNTIALPDDRAGDLGLHVGDKTTIRLGDGSAADLTVVALLHTKPGFDSFLLPADLLAAHTTSGLPGQILVRAKPGVDPAALTGALRQAVADRPGIAVGDRDAMLAANLQKQNIGAWVNYLMVGMITLYTVIAVVNTQVMGTARRRREFGLQRLIGVHRGQVLRMMSVEAGLVALVGLLLGTLVSMTTLVPFSLLVNDSPVPSGPLGIYLGIVGASVVLVFAGTLLPAWLTTRGRPAEAVAADE